MAKSDASTLPSRVLFETVKVHHALCLDGRGENINAGQWRHYPRLYVLSLKRRLTLDVAARVTRIGPGRASNKEGES
jgi:hypothetical protein